MRGRMSSTPLFLARASVSGSESMRARRSIGIVTTLFVAALPLTARAQHEGHGAMPMPMPGQTSGSMEHAPGGMNMPDMDMSDPIGVPMTREASGTSWQPDQTPMRAVHTMVSGWKLIFHENVFVGFDAQSSDRGAKLFNSVNWVMGMASRRVGPAEIGARVMLSAEPWTIGGRGYPLLLQSGESYAGEPLHDRQHPHDLFMELALVSSIAVTSDVGVQLYLAPSGEPALGPTAFPHRASARFDPFATIGHHWQDSTHISFGVATLGIYTKLFKLEGSWFNGREPDERRYDIDLRKPDSFSGRLSVNPSANLSMQVSYGWLKSPEEHAPEESLHRLTGSATVAGPAFEHGDYAVTGAIGVNVTSEGRRTQSSLVEGTLDLTPHHAVFGRAEVATKTGEDLVLPEPRAHDRFGMGLVALGYAYSFDPLGPFVPSLAARGALNFLGEDLSTYYGSKTPVGGMVYLKVEAKPMEHGGHGGMTHASPTGASPSCDEIAHACHDRGKQSDLAAECHSLGHEAPSESTCAAKKPACLAECTDAKSPL